MVSSDVNRSCFLSSQPVVRAPAPGTRVPGSAPGACLLVRVPLGHALGSPTPPRSLGLVRRLPATMAWPDFSDRASPATAPRFPMRRRNIRRSDQRSLGSGQGAYAHAGASTRRAAGRSLDAPGRIAFRRMNNVGTLEKPFSRLNGRPTRPLSTLRHTSGTPTHDSGQCGLLDLRCKDFHLYSLSVFPDAFSCRAWPASTSLRRLCFA